MHNNPSRELEQSTMGYQNNMRKLHKSSLVTHGKYQNNVKTTKQDSTSKTLKFENFGTQNPSNNQPQE